MQWSSLTFAKVNPSVVSLSLQISKTDSMMSSPKVDLFSMFNFDLLPICYNHCLLLCCAAPLQIISYTSCTLSKSQEKIKSCLQNVCLTKIILRTLLLVSLQPSTLHFRKETQFTIVSKRQRKAKDWGENWKVSHCQRYFSDLSGYQWLSSSDGKSRISLLSLACRL